METLWQRLKKGLQKTSHQLAKVMNFKVLDDAVLDEIEDSLIIADVGVKTAADIRKKLATSHIQTPQQAKELLRTELTERLAPVQAELTIHPNKPFVILMIGVNGTGKTTTIGKLASQWKQKGYRVALGAIDTFRMAAIEQLQEWGQKTNCPVYANKIGADAAGTAYDALLSARKNNDDILLLDTAGRLQNKDDLMLQLQKIIRVLKKVDETAPHAVLLTLDASVGQNALSQVATFKEMTNVTGLIMTKLDGTAKGGILIALAEQYHLPIHYIGVGEKIEDLQAFDAASFVNSLLETEHE